MRTQALPVLRTRWRRLPVRWEASGCSRHSTARSSPLVRGTSKGTQSYALEAPRRAFGAIRAARRTIRGGGFATRSENVYASNTDDLALRRVCFCLRARRSRSTERQKVHGCLEKDP